MMLSNLRPAMFTILVAVGAFVPAWAANLDVGAVYLKNVTYGGTGCPQGSKQFVISPNRDKLIGVFDGYQASIGAGVPITEARKNCQVNLDIQYPSGWQYSASSYTYAGEVDLEDDVTALHKTTYYFSGQSAQTSTSTPFIGPTSPKNTTFTITEPVPAASTLWSPCGASLPLNINTQVRLVRTGGNVSASGNISESGVEIVEFAWRGC